MNNSRKTVYRLFLPLAIIAMMIISCRFITSPESPTAGPVNSAQAKTLPVATSYPTISLQSVVTIPEVQFTEVPGTHSQAEAILIQSPLSGDHVSSELSINGISDLAFEQNLVLLLVDHNGNELLRKSTTIQADAGKRGSFQANLTVPTGIAGPAILQVLSTSPKDGSLVHLSSVLIILDSKNVAGTPMDTLDEKISVLSITNPSSNPDVAFEVHGTAWGLFENTLAYTICGEESGNQRDIICGTLENRLSEGVTTINAPNMGQMGSFTISIPKSISLPPSARIIIYSVSPMNGAVDHAASCPLVVSK